MVNDSSNGQYAWATPDDRALRILAHHSQLLEIGCGANAYWCRQLIEWSAQLQDGGVDMVGVWTWHRDRAGKSQHHFVTAYQYTTGDEYQQPVEWNRRCFDQ